MNRSVEIQDIFKEYGNSYLKTHHLPLHVQKSVRAIINCRTSVLGGHMDVCECGYTKISYNSCRNRHCPKCQSLSKERWIMARTEELLPVPYFHVVFTLPSELNGIVMQNREQMFNLLFKASQETIRELARDKKYLGAEIGLTAILHTWGQNLTFHPHVHMIVPGGGLTSDGKWKNSRKKFFIPVKVMAKLFRGKFLFYLQQAHPAARSVSEANERAKLNLEDLLNDLKDARQFHTFIQTLYNKDWYVYCKRPFKTTNSVLEYLGRYTHRVAISNYRILSSENGQVTFKYRDYKNSNKEKVMTLTAFEFMNRFLIHILPPQFTKIRHYGFLASAVKSRKLALCKKLLGMKNIMISPKKPDAAKLIQILTGVDVTLCPVCGAKLTRASPHYLTA